MDKTPEESENPAKSAAMQGEFAIATTIRVPKTGGLPATKVNVPFSEPLEKHVLPNEEKIVQAVKAVLTKKAAAVW